MEKEFELLKNPFDGLSNYEEEIEINDRYKKYIGWIIKL